MNRIADNGAAVEDVSEVETLRKQLVDQHAKIADLELRANTTIRVLEIRREEVETRLTQALVELNLLQSKQPKD